MFCFHRNGQFFVGCRWIGDLIEASETSARIFVSTWKYIFVSALHRDERKEIKRLKWFL